MVEDTTQLPLDGNLMVLDLAQREFLNDIIVAAMEVIEQAYQEAEAQIPQRPAKEQADLMMLMARLEPIRTYAQQGLALLREARTFVATHRNTKKNEIVQLVLTGTNQHDKAGAVVYRDSSYKCHMLPWIAFVESFEKVTPDGN